MKNNRYLTRKTNQFIELVTCISISCEEIKKEDLQYKIEKSSLVSGSRLELPSAAADMNPLLPSLTEISFSFLYLIKFQKSNQRQKKNRNLFEY